MVTRAIHDYFIGRSLEEVRPGGVAAIVTSRYTLDKVNDSFRAWAGERASLLGAIRLPSGAFRQNAGTDVVTDILFLQRRFEGSGPSAAWREVGTYERELDLFWLKDESLLDADNLPIADDLRSALEQIEEILGALRSLVPDV